MKLSNVRWPKFLPKNLFAAPPWVYKGIFGMYFLFTICAIASFLVQENPSLLAKATETGTVTHGVAKAEVDTEAEAILSFDSDIVIEEGNQLLVTETIKFRAQGKKIKRCLYRRLPLSSRFGNGEADFWRAIAPKKDGAISSKYNILGDEEEESGPRRAVISICQKRFRFKPGVYEYTISYGISKQIDFDNSRLLWDVTGDDWPVPVEKATATVHFPESMPLKSVSLAGFTGYAYDFALSSDGLVKASPFFPWQKTPKSENKQNKAYESTVTEEGALKLESTRQLLQPGEGLSPFGKPGESLNILVTFPDGYLSNHVPLKNKLSNAATDILIWIVSVAFGYACIVLMEWKEGSFRNRR